MVQRSLLLFFCAASGLSACGEAAPKGQVLAIVNGEEVTVGELRAEAAARDLPNAEDPAVRSELLRDVVDRKLWAQEARRDRLDQQIEFVLARRRAEEVLLAGLLTRTIGDSVEPPSTSDVATLLQKNPSAYSSRTVFRIEQIDFQPNGDPALAERLAKAQSLDEVDQLLTGSGIVSQRSRTEWDSNFMPAPLATELRRLPPGRPFLHRDADKAIAGVVTGKTDVPLGPGAREILARRSLAQQNADAAVSKRLDQIRASAKISYKAGSTPASPAR